ncbi:hypothetical protein [Octadecabacter antarcticus]|uniref:hypothetical protein n=1 Tax=Octadecabacter antarcticus TaxID=1217908 RepID=UPI002FDE952B
MNIPAPANTASFSQSTSPLSAAMTSNHCEKRATAGVIDSPSAAGNLSPSTVASVLVIK